MTDWRQVRAGAAYAGDLTNLSGDLTTPDKFSVLWWRRLFASRGSIPISELQSLTGVAPNDPKFPGGVGANPLAKNLFFAGDLFPDGQGGLRLVGPNGLTAADMAGPDYARRDDATFNPDADRAEGYTIVSKSAVPRGNIDVPEYGSARPAALDAEFQKNGGVRYVVLLNPVYGGAKQFLFRGTGLQDVGAAWGQAVDCNAARAPFDAELANFDSMYRALPDNGDLDGNGSTSKLGARLAIMVRGNASVMSNGCAMPYPQAAGYTENAAANTQRLGGVARPMPTPTPTPSTPIPGPATVLVPNDGGGIVYNGPPEGHPPALLPPAELTPPVATGPVQTTTPYTPATGPTDAGGGTIIVDPGSIDTPTPSTGKPNYLLLGAAGFLAYLLGKRRK